MQANHYYNKFVAVTPNDATDLPDYGGQTNRLTKALYIGGAGSIVVLAEDQTATTFVNAQAGAFLWLGVRRVKATGTTATNIVALYEI